MVVILLIIIACVLLFGKEETKDGIIALIGTIIVFSEDKPKYYPFWSSGGGINPNYEGTWEGAWRIDVNEIPEQFRKYAAEIDEVFNDNVPWGCCGGCI